MADDTRDVRIEHPNRKKAASKVTRLIVVVLLLASAGLLAIITWGGWDTLEGAKPLQIAYIALYLLMAFLVLRWSRGILPVASALAIIMLIFAAVSAPAWFDRDKSGFASPTLDVGLIGLLTALMVPLQILLIAFAMSGFRQAWNVEVEHAPEDDRGRDGNDRRERAERGDASPAPA
jgi:FtsH-binding integral membrane protein